MSNPYGETTLNTELIALEKAVETFNQSKHFLPLRDWAEIVIDVERKFRVVRGSQYAKNNEFYPTGVRA